ncbi:MAG: periplasmic heavy metal sensor [bacterium]|nr:periplasmic heavy metal sensor [bacterium]
MAKKLIYLLLAVSFGLNVGMVTTTLMHRKAPGGRPGPGPGGGGGPGPGGRPDPGDLVEQHVRGVTEHLGLDAEQQQAIRAVLERHAPLMVEFQNQVEETGRRLAEAYGASDFDPEIFRRLTAEASDARSRLDSLSAVALVAEAAVLTPEQRRMFARVAPTIHSRPRRQPPRDGPPPAPRHP